MPDLRSATWTGPDAYTSVPGAKRFEYFEMAPALVLGSKVAAEYALHLGFDFIAQRVQHLAGLTRTLLAELPGVQVLDRGEELCGIVTAHCPDWDTRALLESLWQQQINVRVSPPQVAQIDFARKGVEWALRISPHYYNTEEEVERTVEAIHRFGSRH